MGHFARECPEFASAPYPGSFRGRGAPIAPFGRGRGAPGDYGSSKCLKCNKSVFISPCIWIC